MKISVKQLKHIINEAKFRIKEDINIEQSLENTPSGEDSLDSQVDRYLGEYELEAKSAKVEGKDWRRTMKRFLFEDEAEKSEPEPEEPEDQEDPEEDVDEKPQLNTDQIDVGSFTNSVVRLIDNYDSLLEVRNTILRRAHKFLEKNYDQSVTKSFEDNLLEDHGLEIGKSHLDSTSGKFQAPSAERAGDGGSGGGGGP